MPPGRYGTNCFEHYLMDTSDVSVGTIVDQYATIPVTKHLKIVKTKVRLTP